MATTTRRFLTSNSYQIKPSSARLACTELLARLGDGIVSTRRQLLDANQLHLLNVTLGRSSGKDKTPRERTPIPPGYHLVYFTPSILEAELGPDGSDRTVNPLSPYTRRMWAGGELHWNQDPRRLLRVGQMVQETTRLQSAEPKSLRSGGDMLVVGVEKSFENEYGIALVDRRNWVFRREITAETATPHPARPEEHPLPSGQHVRDFRQTPVSLFRFSALTFNGHKIHYDPEWCHAVEGHRDAVVHGPLNLINMLDLWRDTTSKGVAETVPKSIKYRAMSPVYVNEKYRIVLDKDDAMWKIELWDSFAKMGMKGVIVD